MSYTFSDVLIRPLYSEIESRTKVDLSSDFMGFNLKLPVMSANMPNISGSKMCIAMYRYGAIGVLHRQYKTIEQNINEYKEVIKSGSNCIVSIGVKQNGITLFESLRENGATKFCIDTAHGHHKHVKDMLNYIRSNYGNDFMIIAGNIASVEAAKDLKSWGADILKVGIGPGSKCRTRTNAGVGTCQLSTLEEIRNSIDIPLIADGGIKSVGDIAKALKFANIVMCGGLFAGTSETPGNVYKNDKGEFYKMFGGSASGENKGENRFVEGEMSQVSFKGKVKYILREIQDGLQSACSYTNSNNLTEFKKNCEFEFLSSGGRQESKH